MRRRILTAATRAVRTHWKRIFYYAGVAAVLCAVAACAEAYRLKPRPSEAADVIAPPPQPTAEAPSAAFAMPEDAEILRRYARQPEWNETLSMYETHEGLDLAFPDSVVRSASDGMVISVDGGAIVIAAGAYTVVYRSIEPDVGIGVGASVEIGEALGSASNSAHTEAWMPPHTHLEVSEAGKTVDPEKLLVKNPVIKSALD